MSEHLTQNQIEDFGRRTLSAAELLSASDHLVGCETCRRQVERALDGDAAFFALKSQVFGEAAETLASPGEPAHLAFEQTAGYVDGTLAGEELQEVKDHLISCEQCAMTVNDLEAFRDQVVPSLDRELQPISSHAATEISWRRPVAFLPSLLPKPSALVFGSALAAILLIAAGWLIWQALERKENKPEVTKTKPSPTAPVVPPSPSPASPLQDTGEMTLAQLNDGGGSMILDREGKLTGIDHLPARYQQMIKEALINQRLEKSPLLAGLARPDLLSMRSGDNQGINFSVIRPIGKVLLSDRPTFRWSRLEGAIGYVVEVYDEKYVLAATGSQLSDTSWTPPQSLKRGGLYSWQVKAIKDGQEFFSPRAPAPQAKFRILDEAKANELVQARRSYASSHLTLALLYTQAGLLDEAERELRALKKANPNSTIARRLLANVQALRH